MIIKAVSSLWKINANRFPSAVVLYLEVPGAGASEVFGPICGHRALPDCVDRVQPVAPGRSGVQLHHRPHPQRSCSIV
ncbi:hypothetical protein EYF80_043652 [Liparis tanakae]|uniref:Uncharacterized protein n=1 Tax=Liparis tanakae TaxID=230148 RepID=A0A4Z2FY17_9TELE|nr:hypothetical protein EYF80_043652 [Liparis tanakae]